MSDPARATDDALIRRAVAAIERSDPARATDDALIRRAVAAIERIADALQSIARELHVANGLRTPVDFP